MKAKVGEELVKIIFGNVWKDVKNGGWNHRSMDRLMVHKWTKNESWNGWEIKAELVVKM